MPPEQLPGSRWFDWLRNAALRVGVLTGIYLSLVLAAWLIIANRVPWSANFAGIRNAAAAALVLLLMLIPVGCFLKSPARLFVCGLTAWAEFTLTYVALGLYFERLFSRWGPFRVFTVGVVSYGVMAVLAWVVHMVWTARHQPFAVSRRRIH
jgi:hypothetical protein